MKKLRHCQSATVCIRTWEIQENMVELDFLLTRYNTMYFY